MKPRQSNRIDRRLAPPGSISEQDLADLAVRIRYAIGPRDNNGHHKRRPGDYGYDRGCNPRQNKNLCDEMRIILRNEALALFSSGIQKGMVSPFSPGGTPKYVWAVDAWGFAYEAKTKPPDVVYHGYGLANEPDQHTYVVQEWSRR